MKVERMIVWSDKVGRRLLRMSLRFGKPHRRASCCPHPTEEKSIVPPRRCCVLFHTSRRLGNECFLEEVVDDGLDDDDPFFLVKRLVSFHMVATLSLTNIFIRGFKPVKKVDKYYFGV
jgi:hypothetical protein